jgi:hypothetical protein
MSCLDQDSLYVGQDWVRLVPLKADGVPFDITSATVTAQLVSVNKTSATTNGSAISCADSGGADFSAGLVRVVFADTDTTGLTGGDWQLEIKVVESGTAIKIFHASPSIKVIPTGQG